LNQAIPSRGVRAKKSVSSGDSWLIAKTGMGLDLDFPWQEP
jgi:hypothetical protein